MELTRTGRRAFLVVVIAIALLVGVMVPFLAGYPQALAILGIVPGLVLLWNPEILVVLLQDALGILRVLTGGIGLSIESGFAIATMLAAVAGYGLLALRFRLNFRALLSPLALLNYAMAATLAVALVHSGGSQYGVQKLVGFVAFNILGFVLTSITPPERRRRLLYGFIWIGLAAVMSMVVAGVGAQASSRRAAFGGNPIWTARLLCAAALITLWSPRGSLVLRVPLALLFLGASVLTGSRGPLLTAGVVIIVALLGKTFLARDRQSVGASLVMLFGLIFVVGAGFAGLRALAIQQAVTNPKSPFVRVFASNPDTQQSSAARVDMYGISLAEFGEHPVFGVGLGGLAAPLEETGNLYSHNLVLEIAAETGLIGLLIHFATLILTVLIAVIYLRSPDRQVREDLEIGLSMLLFSYANAQVSGDLVGNKMVWFFLGFLNGIIPAWHVGRWKPRVAVRRRPLRIGNWHLHERT